VTSDTSEFHSVADAIRDGSYLQHPIDPAILGVPGLISPQERTLLSFLAARCWRPGDRIVDAGCFLGSSTRALLDGLVQNPHFARGPAPIVHSYDLFIADQATASTYLPGMGVEPGGSFEALFRANVEAQREWVAVHAGDVRTHVWSGEPIRILFLDVIWSWDINGFVMRNFYPHLCADGAFVVHQDYVYAWYPYIPISMEYFGDHFEFIGYVPLATVAFRSRKPLDARDVAVDLLHDLDPETLLLLMARAIDRFSGDLRGVLECSRASLLRYFDRTDEARILLTDVAARYKSSEGPARFARDILAHIDSGAPARVV